MPRRSIFSPWSGALLICIFAACLAYYLPLYTTNDPKTPHLHASASSLPKFNATGQTPICVALSAALPESVYTSQHPTFQHSANSYWSLNACESVPACIVQPADTHEVATAVRLLKAQFDAGDDEPVRFAVRSGGHSPERGFASVDHGVVIDMRRLDEVVVADDRLSTRIGVGARWRDVYGKLDGMGLSMVGGRNANVGVGGLVLGGGISFFSPRYGMVCDNISAYDLVLANGTTLHITSTHHPDIFRALKGGSANFGILTHITAKTFPSGPIWSGYAFWAPWQTPKILAAFHEFNHPKNFDAYAAGPIVALSYAQSVGVRLVAANLAYTKPVAWARVFDGFRAVWWRVWSTHKIQSMTSSAEELNRMSPSGLRQYQVTTTIKNDLATFLAFDEIYAEKLREVRRVGGSVWSLIFQPLSKAVTRKGDPNVLGLETRHVDDTIVVVLISVSWRNAKDDELVHRVSREVIALGEEMARTKGTSDPYRYLNYAAGGQDPIGGYGVANREFLHEVSRRYDPEGFFQRAKQGGFKLDMY